MPIVVSLRCTQLCCAQLCSAQLAVGAHSALQLPQMRIAIFSDLHDNLDAFHAVLMDATRQQAERLIYLGDVGHNLLLFAELQKRQIPSVYGNWEVSGLSRLPGDIHQWVASWPATIQDENAIYAHATPDMPASAATTAAAAAYIRSGVGRIDLFPRLNSNEEARWRAFAALEEQNLRVAFHGHTHVQQIWAWETNASGERRVRQLNESTAFSLQPGPPTAPNRYLIGVGSAGLPNDGPVGRYVIYDQARQEILLRTL